jgi:predicted nucleic acid-binding protein
VRVLVDTSVWVDHFRRSDSRLIQTLTRQEVVIHPIVIGELATSNLRNRAPTLADLQTLPRVEEVSFAETLSFLEMRRLYGRGLEWNDIQLLASALLNGLSLWSSDKQLHKSARELRLT